MSEGLVLESFVEFIGVLKDVPKTRMVLRRPKNGNPNELDWEPVPPEQQPPAEVRQGFKVTHEGKEDLALFINKAFQELAMLGGMLTHKKEPHAQWDFNNQVFTPMHMFSRIECSVKRITAPPVNPDSLDPDKETVN